VGDAIRRRDGKRPKRSSAAEWPRRYSNVLGFLLHQQEELAAAQAGEVLLIGWHYERFEAVG
jgi:lipopolysaccharide biosynthesis regulator YciM